MQIIQTHILSASQKESIFSLWNKEYPANISYTAMAELDDYLSGLQDAVHYFMEYDTAVTGWGTVFERDDQNWFAIIIDSSLHKKGYGSALLNIMKEQFDELNGWVVDHAADKKPDGTTYISPLPFYRKNDFTVMVDTRLERDTISAVKIHWKK